MERSVIEVRVDDCRQAAVPVIPPMGGCLDDGGHERVENLKAEGSSSTDRMTGPPSTNTDIREETGRRSRTGRWIAKDDCGCSGCRFADSYGDMCGTDNKRKRKRKQGKQAKVKQVGIELDKSASKGSGRFVQHQMGKPSGCHMEDETENGQETCRNLGDKKARMSAEGNVKSREGSKSAVSNPSVEGGQSAGMESLGEDEVAGKRRPWDAWTVEEERSFFNALRKVGKNFVKIQERVQTKSKEQVRHHYYQMVKRLNQLLTPSLALDARKFMEANQALLGWWQLMDGNNTNYLKLRSKPKRLKHYVNVLERKILISRKTADRTEMKKAEAAAAAAADFGIGTSSDTGKVGSDGSGGGGKLAGKSGAKGGGASAKASTQGKLVGDVDRLQQGSTLCAAAAAAAAGKRISHVCVSGKFGRSRIIGQKLGKGQLSRGQTLNVCGKSLSASGKGAQNRCKTGSNSQDGLQETMQQQLSSSKKLDSELAERLVLVVEAAAHLEQDRTKERTSKCGGESMANVNAEGQTGSHSSAEEAPTVAQARIVKNAINNTEQSPPPTVVEPVATEVQRGTGTLEGQGAEKAKFELQLFPMNEFCKRAVEQVGQNPHLALTLGKKKAISSVVKHLVQKWGRPGSVLSNFRLVPFLETGKLSDPKLSWDSGSTDFTAGDVHSRIGSPSLFRLRYLWDLPKPSDSHPHHPTDTQQRSALAVSSCLHQACLHCGQPPAHLEKSALATNCPSSAVPPITVPSPSAASQGAEDQEVIVSCKHPVVAVSVNLESTKLSVKGAQLVETNVGLDMATIPHKQLSGTGALPVCGTLDGLGGSIPNQGMGMCETRVGAGSELVGADGKMSVDCQLNRQSEDSEELAEGDNPSFEIQESREIARLSDTNGDAAELTDGVAHCSSMMSPRREKGSPFKARSLQAGHFSPGIGHVEGSQAGLAHWTYEESNDGFGRHAWREDTEDILPGGGFPLAQIQDHSASFHNAGDNRDTSDMLWVDNASQISISQLLGFDDVQVGAAKGCTHPGQENNGNTPILAKQSEGHQGTSGRGVPSCGPNDFQSPPSHSFSSLFNFQQERSPGSAIINGPLGQSGSSFDFGPSRGESQCPGIPGVFFGKTSERFGSGLGTMNSGVCETLDGFDMDIELPGREGTEKDIAPFQRPGSVVAVIPQSDVWCPDDACDQFCFPQPAATGHEEQTASGVLHMGMVDRHHENSFEPGKERLSPVPSDFTDTPMPHSSVLRQKESPCEDSGHLDLDWVGSFDIPLTPNSGNQHEGNLFDGDISLSMSGMGSLLQRISGGVLNGVIGSGQELEGRPENLETTGIRNGCTHGAQSNGRLVCVQAATVALGTKDASFTKVPASGLPFDVTVGRGSLRSLTTAEIGIERWDCGEDSRTATRGEPQLFDAFFTDLPDQVTEEELQRVPATMPSTSSQIQQAPVISINEVSHTGRVAPSRVRGSRGACTEAGKGRSKASGSGSRNTGKVGDGSADAVLEAGGEMSTRTDGKSKGRGGGGGKRQKVDGGGSVARKRANANDNNEDAVASANRAAAAAMGFSLSFACGASGMKMMSATAPPRPAPLLKTVAPCSM